MILSRRNFLRTLGTAAACMGFAEPYASIAQSLKRKIKITDVKLMIVRGTWDWNLIKVETDSGLYGLGEAYWGPGVRDMIEKQFKALLIGEDPLNVDRLYKKMLLRSGGYGAIGGVTISAASGVEIALWDLAGRILQTPVCNLLGGRFRDRVRFYKTLQLPSGNPAEASAWKHQAEEAVANNPMALPRSSSRATAYRQRQIPTSPNRGTIPTRCSSPTATYDASSSAWSLHATPSVPMSTWPSSVIGSTA